MHFIKVEEKIILEDWYYTVIKTLIYDQSNSNSSEILFNLINSKYHFWQGEKDPVGGNWNWTDENGSREIHNVKFYGFFNNDLIVPSDYIQISIEELFNLIFESINKDLEEENKILGEEHLHKVKAEIEKLNLKDFEIYHLNLDEGKDIDKIHQCSVFTSFIAFALINKKVNQVVIIQSGDD